MADQPPFKPGSSYNTKLDPLSELAFRGWVQKNDVPFDLATLGNTDYDIRGYWQALQNGNPQARPAEVNPNDNRPHFTDYFKTPLHQTFSSESQWATPDTPQWTSLSQLGAPNGRVVFDEKTGGDPRDLKLQIARLLMGQR